MGSDHISWKQRLQDLNAELKSASQATQGDRATVVLDQQSVGRLSRMDAIQQQAMAQAEKARRAVLAIRFKAALERLEDGEFGYCAECGDQIPTARLEIDPTAPLCVGCAKTG